MGRGLTRVLDALRPHPHRGDVIAAGAVVLTAGLLMMDVRMNSVWEDGAMLFFFALGAVVVFGMGMLARLEGPEPRAYHSILLLAGLVLLTAAFAQLALVLGARSVFPPVDAGIPTGGWTSYAPTDALPFAPSEGALTWVAAVSTAFAILAAVRANSAACTLWAAIAGTIAAVAFVNFAFAPEGGATARWILLALIVGFAFGLAYLRERHRRHAVMLVDAAGIALITIAASFTAEGAYFTHSLPTPAVAGALFSAGGAEVGFGWDVVLLFGSFGLIAFAAADRETSPGVIGAFALVLSVLVVGRPGMDVSLIGWPLFLAIVGVAGIVFGLRPRRELPPPPDADAGEAETRPMPPPTSIP